MKCDACGKELESTKGCAFKVSGWERERKGGGTNHVLWRERTGEVMCPGCVVDRTYGVTEDQLRLA